MKYLAVIAMSVILFGCTHSVTPEAMEKAIKLCVSAEGVSYVMRTGTNSYMVKCKDETEMSFKIKGRFN